MALEVGGGPAVFGARPRRATVEKVGGRCGGGMEASARRRGPSGAAVEAAALASALGPLRSCQPARAIFGPLVVPWYRFSLFTFCLRSQSIAIKSLKTTKACFFRFTICL